MDKAYEILPFFLLPDAENRLGFCFNDILGWDDETLEVKHDYIQWYFPLLVPSNCNGSAPVMTEYEWEYLRNEPVCRARQTKAFNRMLKFYKMERDWLRNIRFTVDDPDWIASDANGVDHNYLRITRILHSLNLLGNHRDAKRLYEALMKKDKECFPVFPLKTTVFWQDALKETK